MSQLQKPEAQIPVVDAALLAALLAQAQQAPTQPGAGEPHASHATPRTKRSQSQLVDTLAYAGAACFGLAGWMLGGFFTLTACAAVGLPIVAQIDWPWALPANALICWLIPLSVSLIEVRFWPNGANGWRSWLFWAISLLDVASTVYGLSVALADKPIPLGAGFTLARGSDALWMVACVLALILTFAPEQIVTRSIAGLRDLWK
jgi:hypothetical protein